MKSIATHGGAVKTPYRVEFGPHRVWLAGQLMVKQPRQPNEISSTDLGLLETVSEEVNIDPHTVVTPESL